MATESPLLALEVSRKKEKEDEDEKGKFVWFFHLSS